MDYSFLDRAFKAVTPETWKLMNEELAKEAVRSHDLDVSKIRVDSTVIETNIHYPTDISLLWDAYCVLTRLLRAVRDLEPELCPHRFHDRKAKQDYLYVTRYQQSKSKDRRRKVKRHFRRLHTTVRRIRDVGRETVRQITGESPLELQGLKIQLKHYLPLVGTVLNTSERAFLKGEKVPAEERIFSLFEEHTELIMRGKARKPVEFGHAIWITQNPDKLILDYEVMDKKVPDAELLEEVTQRHKALYRGYPEGLTADAGFRASAENMEVVKKRVVTLAVPGRGRNKKWMDAAWHRFRAGVEGTFSVLKRAFRLIVCLYRGFKSFEAAVGMAVFCHNLRLVAPARANP
jgi:IS5 family transposase